MLSYLVKIRPAQTDFNNYNEEMLENVYESLTFCDSLSFISKIYYFIISPSYIFASPTQGKTIANQNRLCFHLHVIYFTTYCSSLDLETHDILCTFISNIIPYYAKVLMYLRSDHFILFNHSF